MAGKRTISKAKGVEICVDMMFVGAKRKEIVLECTEKYGVSVSAVEKWILAARPVLAERQAAAKALQEQADREAAEASAKRLNLTREAMLERLGEIIHHGKKTEKPAEVTALGDLEDQEETESRLYVKAPDVINAIKEVNKMQGYYAPEKKEIKGDVTLTDLPITFD